MTKPVEVEETVTLTETEEAKFERGSIPFAPSRRGYVNYAMLFHAQVLNNVPKSKREATERLLYSLLDITRYLASTGDVNIEQDLMSSLDDDGVYRAYPKR